MYIQTPNSLFTWTHAGTEAHNTNKTNHKGRGRVAGVAFNGISLSIKEKQLYHMALSIFKGVRRQIWSAIEFTDATAPDDDVASVNAMVNVCT